MKSFWKENWFLLLVLVIVIYKSYIDKDGDILNDKVKKELIESKVRQEHILEEIKKLNKEHVTIAADSNKINKDHEKIRNNPISGPVYDSLVRSIIERGKKRFD